jgi:hypothetical protein
MTRHRPRIEFLAVESAKKINDITPFYLPGLPQSLLGSVFNEFREISAIGVDGILREGLFDAQIV